MKGWSPFFLPVLPFLDPTYLKLASLQVPASQKERRWAAYAEEVQERQALKRDKSVTTPPSYPLRSLGVKPTSTGGAGGSPLRSYLASKVMSSEIEMSWCRTQGGQGVLSTRP